MTSESPIFRDLRGVTFQLTTACNLSCDYCFQDACNVCVSPPGQGTGMVDPVKTAETLIKLLDFSAEDMGMVFSGGEPLLAPVDWYETFFALMDRYLERSGRTLEYSIQTNISILNPAIIPLFKKHDVHFSVHYDGELDDPKISSKRRRDNIVTLREMGFPVSALVVGTVESLKALPSTVEFFAKHGVRFYRVNCVSSQGRGHQVAQIPPKLRAEAEFEAAFLASQFDFATRDNVGLNKFLFYYNHVLCGGAQNPSPRPQKCMAGLWSAYVDVDGLVFPCSFFTGVTGPIAKAEDLPSAMDGAMKVIELCEAPNAYYEEKCKGCEAFPICGEYCALQPVTDTDVMESFCNAQVTLRRLMDENRQIAELIAKRFLAHRKAYPDDVPKSCGTRARQM